jgi:hypothetical protein
MDHERHSYRARLDFLYQSIAMYAATIVIYLIARSLFISKSFPDVWRDPLLMLLCAITLISVVGLLYNLFMQRRLEVVEDKLIFRSRARERVVKRSEVRSIQFGRERTGTERGVRVVKLRLSTRRRPVRIRVSNFEHSRRLLHDLKEWSQGLPVAHSRARLPGRTRGGKESPNDSGGRNPA